MNAILLQCAGATTILKCGCNLTTATNENDLEIAKTICWAIVCVAGCLVAGFLAWKLLDHIANGISGLYKRRCEVKDKVFKQKGDMLDKLTDFLKAQTEEKGNDGKVIRNKPYDNKECKAYRETLCDMLNALENKDKNIDILKKTMKQERDQPSGTDQPESSIQIPEKWHMKILRFLRLADR